MSRIFLFCGPYWKYYWYPQNYCPYFLFSPNELEKMISNKDYNPAFRKNKIDLLLYFNTRKCIMFLRISKATKINVKKSKHVFIRMQLVYYPVKYI